MENNSRIWECLCKAGKGQSGTSTLPLEFLSSEQIWRSPSGEANPFLANRGFQTQAGWLPLLAWRRLAFPASYDPWFPAWGKSRSWRSLLRGCFHGAGVMPRDGPGCSPDLDWGVWHLVVQALSTLFVSQHPCTLHEWNLGFSSSFNCPSSQAELSLLCRTPRPRHQVCFSFFLSFAALIEWVPVPFVWIYWFFTLLYVLFSQISLAFYFSVKHLHFFKLCNFCLVLSHTFYLFVEVLTVLIHSAPDFSNHLHDHHF